MKSVIINSLTDTEELEIIVGLLYMGSELVNNMILVFALNFGTDFRWTMNSYF